jgi:molybdopterin synthase catalytic subunit
MGVVARLDATELVPERELAALLADAEGAGALVSFVGVARPEGASGEPVACLLLEHHPRLTLRSLEEIAGEAARRFDASHVRVVHRCGAIAAGAPIVFAGAAARHRRAAFEAADYLMDRLKTDAIFWKREEGAGGSRWIEPTEADYADRTRWER